MPECKFSSRIAKLVVATAVGIVGAPLAAGASGLSDAQILGIYAQVNSFDIETALLGESKASSAAVRSLARHVARDHSKVRETVFDVARKCGVNPELPTSRNEAFETHSRALTSLAEKQGSAFDQAYLRHEVAFHESAIKAVRETLLPGATCPDLKTHLQTVLPAFEHHLAETRRLLPAKP